ncbi:MAG: hypothetical protein K0S39_5742 [Paenibacillus sp.]|jgi:hypothetical protein|nr:hypothetical protein [Paenibacillus sp.]
MLQTDMLKWIQQQQVPDSFISTGVTKNMYLDIMERTLNAYNKDELERRLPQKSAGKVDDIQAYSRITSIIGILISKGRLKGYRVLWERMMDACCLEFHRARHNPMVDFSVKEIMVAYMAMNDQLDETVQTRWLAELSKVEPERNYFHLLREGRDPSKLHNINVYNMVGEYLRETVGLTETKPYFARHWPVQLELFDENGMYRDPNCPILYDLATRCQIQLMLHYGYRGPYFEALDGLLKKAGLCTLFMQSAAFQFPYGGRSNQYLFNEALVAANAEYEACRYRDLGDLKTAGAFKRCARLAVQSIFRWLQREPPRHIKNMYAVDSKIGTESYGYYDKYMATLGSFIYLAHLFADDQIPEQPCPAETGGYIWETSDDFHKIFANAAGYSLQIDTKADHHYDSTGLGRFHRRGVPGELGLSAPFTATPSYVLPEEAQGANLTIGPGWTDGSGSRIFLSDLSEGLEHKLHVLEVDSSQVLFELEYYGDAIKGCTSVKERYLLSEKGLEIQTGLDGYSGSEPLLFRIPVLHSNGQDVTKLIGEAAAGEISVALEDRMYVVRTNGSCKITDFTIANRNGRYFVLQLEGQLQASVHLQLH